MWSDLYQLRVSGWVDRNSNPNPNPNPNPNLNPNPNPNPDPKERKGEMFRLKCVFETYFKVGNIFLRGWQVGSKMSSYV